MVAYISDFICLEVMVHELLLKLAIISIVCPVVCNLLNYDWKGTKNDRENCFRDKKVKKRKWNQVSLRRETLKEWETENITREVFKENRMVPTFSLIVCHHCLSIFLIKYSQHRKVSGLLSVWCFFYVR